MSRARSVLRAACLVEPRLRPHELLLRRSHLASARGPFPANWREISYGPSLIGGNTLREGAVWKPFIERSDPQVGRLMLKAVDPEYLAKQKD